MKEKPILFNTDMVRAILDGRKTVTRRVCRITVNGTEPVDHRKCVNVVYPERSFKGICEIFSDNSEFYVGTSYQPYHAGDILWVRETWGYDKNMWIYRADFSDEDLEKIACITKWHPSIHMPREAARIFLRVTDVRVERVQEITRDEAIDEGCNTAIPILEFKAIWNSTIKPTDRDRYGWAANPWVWVIAFERIERPVSGE